MKGTSFTKSLEWNIETVRESWQQGDTIEGSLSVKNHGTETVTLTTCGVGLAFADIKKVQTRAEGALKPEVTQGFSDTELSPGATSSTQFSFSLSPNGNVTDKKGSYYLTFGREFIESQLQLKVEPKLLFSKIIGLLDTFHRFKLKEYKSSKKGVEFKLIPPTAREMANVESLLLTFSMDGENLNLRFEFQVKKLDTSSVTTKINKQTVTIEKVVTPKEYSLGRDMINQDKLLQVTESVLSEIKMKAVF
jgi:hypothetical protein